jgi:hypothetical protein
VTAKQQKPLGRAAAQEPSTTLRTAWRCLLAWAAVGLLLRVLCIQGRGLSHFDEGVYALWAHGVNYPGHMFFAPPLFPSLLALPTYLMPWHDTMLLAFNAVLGAAAAVVAGTVAWKWFGPASGAFATALVAMSSFHLEMSSTALTDMLFSVVFLLGVYFAEGLFGPSSFQPHRSPFQWATWWAAYTACSGLALWTKYTGPLVLLAGPAAVAAFLIAYRQTVPRRQVLVPASFRLLLWAAAMATAWASYMPWFRYVAGQLGSYRVLVAHHRGYLEGWQAWLENAASYLYFSELLCGPASCLSAVLGPLVALRCASHRAAKTSWLGTTAATSLFALGTALFGDAFWLALGGFGALHEGRAKKSSWEKSLTCALMCGVLLLILPLYRPYPRLAFPLSCLAWVLGSKYGLEVLDRLSPSGQRPTAAWAAVGVMTFLVTLWLQLVAYWTRPWKGSLTPPGTEAPRPLREAVASLLRQGTEKAGDVLAVVRPALLFYLAGKARVEMAPDRRTFELLDRQGWGKLLLVDSALLRDNPDLRSRLREPSGWTLVGTIPYAPSPLVWLDDFPHGLPELSDGWPYVLQLFERRTTKRDF